MTAHYKYLELWRKESNLWAFVFFKRFQDSSDMHLDFKKWLQVFLLNHSFGDIAFYYSLVDQLWSVQFIHSVMSDSLRPHGLQHARLPWPSPTSRACSNSYPLSPWSTISDIRDQPSTISSSVISFSFCLQFFPASESFPMSQFFTSGGQSTGVSASASVLPMNIQDWFPLGWTGCISLQSKRLSRVFSNTTVQKHQSWSNDIK